MNSENPNTKTGDSKLLSQAGKARRDSMRDELQTEFVRLHARRRRTRTALALSPAFALMIAAATWWAWPVDSAVNPANQVAEVLQPTAPNALLSEPEIAVAETTNSHLEFELINDDQLLDLLAEAGHPSALAWFDGKPVVIPLVKKTTL